MGVAAGSGLDRVVVGSFVSGISVGSGVNCVESAVSEGVRIIDTEGCSVDAGVSIAIELQALKLSMTVIAMQSHICRMCNSSLQ